MEELDTIEDALDFRAHLRLAKRRGVLDDLTRGEITLTEFFENEYWPKDAKRNLQLNSRRTYLPIWYAHLKPRLGHLRLRQLNPPTVQALREQMEEDGIGAPTIRRAMAILQAVCRFALARGEVTSNPVKDVRKPPAPRKRAVVAISPEQVERLLELLDPTSHVLVALLAYEGMRPEDALALEDRHVGKRTILVEQKNVDGQIETGQKTSRPPRSPELWAPVRQDIAAYRLAARREKTRSGLQLLIPRPDGEPWRDHDYRNWRRRVFKPAVKRAEVPISRPYDLRHACASLMIHAGCPLTEIAEHLGNSVAVLSERYAHLISDMRGQRPTSVTHAIMSARRKRARKAR